MNFFWTGDGRCFNSTYQYLLSALPWCIHVQSSVTMSQNSIFFMIPFQKVIYRCLNCYAYAVTWVLLEPTLHRLSITDTCNGKFEAEQWLIWSWFAISSLITIICWELVHNLVQLITKLCWKLSIVFIKFKITWCYNVSEGGTISIIRHKWERILFSWVH
jgi:hypothetical protein